MVHALADLGKHTARVPYWHAKQFPMASRSSNFFTSLLLWFKQKIHCPWLL